MAARATIELTGGAVEYERSPGTSPVLVFLHEGLGSIGLWRGVPGEVAAAAGGAATLVYSRHGHGASARAAMPRPVGYMHHEADVVLPELLDALGIDAPVLVGHSDGASIALLYAGAGHRVAGLVCIAPHVFVEPESVAGIEAAKVAFDTTDLRERMARHHDDPDHVFTGWNDVWRSAAFRAWNIEDRLGAISAPVLAVQGADDQYGTLAQLDAIAAGVGGRCERLVLDAVGHAPHLEARPAVVAAIAAFVRRLG
ncbi:MAG TPA: alpha/beta hydrolase [Ilumatobacter sp.]